ncbi:MAG TPA: murein transglycosylase domain-containing protein [Desulfatiglandales bacterium]|nr:murein transglycosylase domain-containing protein [Desulfatiglandales bacterium]
MMKIVKRVFFLLMIPIIYSFLFLSLSYSEELGKESNEWEKLKRATEETWRKNVLGIEREWDETEAQQRRQLQELKRRIDLLWGEAGVTSTKKNWIDYNENFSVRSNIDFKDGTIEIDALVPLNVSNPYERAKKEISDKMVTSFIAKGIEQEGILTNQLKTSKGFYVTNKNLKNYIQSELFPKINKVPTSIIGNDGNTRLRFGARFSLVPGHLGIRAEKYRNTVQANANRFSLEPQLIMAVIHTESYFNPFARSHAGAYGLMQVIPRYAGREAYQFIYRQDRIITPPYLYQPVNNINLGSAYLYLLYNKHFADIQGRDKRLLLTICGYNWGPTAIRQKIVQRYQISFMPSDKLYRLLRYRTPQETSDYLKRVTERSHLYSNFF